VPLKKHRTYTGPSWSWSAYEGAISYESTCDLLNISRELAAYERTRAISEYTTGDDEDETVEQRKSVSTNIFLRQNIHGLPVLSILNN
jgi:hypothetical protein